MPNQRTLCVLVAGALALFVAGSAFAGTTTNATWTGGGGDNEWNTTGNWSGANQPQGGAANSIIHFAGTTRLTSDNNYGDDSQFQQILFDSGAGSFNLTGSRIKLFNNGGTGKIENSSTNAQTISFSGGSGIGLLLESSFQMSPTQGDITINNQVLMDFNNPTIDVFGGNGHTLTFNGSLNQNNTGGTVGALTIDTNNNVLFNASNNYSGDTTVLAGKLQYGSGGSTPNSTIRLGNTTGTAAAEIDFVTAAGSTTMNNTINPRAGTSGLLSLNSQNTSNINTVSGHIGLDHNFTITQTGGGELDITNLHTDGATAHTGFDIKGFTVTFTPAANGNIVETGDIYSSTGGAGGLILNGAGTLTLSGGVNNTFTGGVSVISGTLALGSDTGAGTGTISLGGTSANTPTLVAVNGARSISNNVTLLATSSGGNPTVAGANNLTLNGTLTNSGANRTLTVNNSSTTTQAGSVFLSEASGSGRTLTLNGSGALTISGAIANFNGAGTAGSLIYSGANTLTLSGPNTYSGATTLNSGTVAIGNSTAFGTSTVSLAGSAIQAVTSAQTVGNTITLDASTTIGGSQNLTFNTGTWTDSSSRTLTNNDSGTLTLAGSVFLSNNNTTTGRGLTVAGSGATAISGVVANNNAGNSVATTLTLNGTGSLTLSGTNTFSGGVTLTAGTLNINSAGSGGTSSALGTGAFSLNGGTIDNTSVNALTLSTNNSVAWGGDFTYGGTKDLNFGTGAVSNSANRTITLGGSGSTLTFGGTLSETNSNTVTVNGTGNTLSLGGLALSGTATARTQTFAGTGNINITGAITNGSATSGDLVFTGTGTMTLSGPNTYSDSGSSVTTIGTTSANAGTLRLSGSGTLGATTNGLTIRGGTLDLNGTTQTIGALLLGGGTTTTPAITLGGGTLNLGATVTYSATNNPNGATISGAGAVNLNGTQTFNIGDSTATTTELAVNSTIADGSTSSGLTKSNLGTMSLGGSGSNTYTGATIITGGELDLNKTGGATALSGNTINVNGSSAILKWAAGTTNEVTTGAMITIGTVGGTSGTGGTVNLNGATQTVVDLTNYTGVFTTGSNGTWSGTGASMTWGANSVSNTIGAGSTLNENHLTISGGTNEIMAGALVQLSLTGLTLNGGSVTIDSDPTTPGKLALMSNVAANDGTTSSINSSSPTNAGVVDLSGGSRTFTVGSSNAATTVNVSASITDGSLVKAGPGSLNLTGNNTFSGTTTINSGSINAGATGALGATSSVTVNSTGTLLLSGAGNLDRVNNSAGIGLAGGTLARSGPGTGANSVSEGSGATIVNGSATGGSNSTGLGALTLTATSTLDFGTGGVGTLAFASFTSGGNVLNITNYMNSSASLANNNSGIDGTDDRLIFNQDQSGNLSAFNFGSGFSAAEIALNGGYFEVFATPVPEPSTYAAGALTLAALVISQRRRLRRFVFKA